MKKFKKQIAISLVLAGILLGLFLSVNFTLAFAPGEELYWLDGDLTPANITEKKEPAIAVRVHRTGKSVIPGDAYSFNMGIIEVINVYNPAKGLTSGNLGFIFVPFTRADVDYHANLFRGDPDYVWANVQGKEYTITNKMNATSKWINMAEILILSGGGGGTITPLYNHSNAEWGAYNQGSPAGFDFTKPVNTDQLRVTDKPRITFFKLNSGQNMTEQSSLEFDFTIYGVYNKKSLPRLYLNDDFTRAYNLPGISSVTSDYQIKTSGQVSWSQLPLELRQRIMADENGGGNNKLTLLVEDGHGREARQDLNFIYKPKDVFVGIDIIADPKTKEFEGKDVEVKVTLKAWVSGLKATDVRGWLIGAKRSESNDFTARNLGAGLVEVSSDYSFTIPKSRLDNVDQYVQKFLGEATVFTADKNYSSGQAGAETTIYKKAPPAEEPAAPGYRKPEAYINNIIGSSSSPQKIEEKEVKIIWDYGSWEEFDPVDYRLEVYEADSSKRVYRFMASEDGEPVEPIKAVAGSRVQRGGFLTELYQIVAKDLKMGEVYFTTIRAYDGHNWSNVSNAEYFMLVERPVADFDFVETELYAGDTIEAINSSYHPGGKDMTARWEVVNLLDGKAKVYTDWDMLAADAAIGLYQVTLTITDTDGVKDSITKTIQVLDPKPQAILQVAGTTKENRRLEIDGSASITPERFPLLENKTKITIRPITGSDVTVIKPANIISGKLAEDILIKAAGSYEIELYVENEKGSSTTKRSVYIAPDKVPFVEFSTPTHIYGTINKDLNYAEFVLKSNSYSPDSDIIANERWSITWNNDNAMINGKPDFTGKTPFINFTSQELLELGGEEKLFTRPITVASETADVPYYAYAKMVEGRPVVYFQTPLIGYYLVELEATEKFGQPTIETYVTDADRRSGTSIGMDMEAKVIMVDNRAPVVEWVK